MNEYCNKDYQKKGRNVKNSEAKTPAQTSQSYIAYTYVYKGKSFDLLIWKVTMYDTMLFMFRQHKSSSLSTYHNLLIDNKLIVRCFDNVLNDEYVRIHSKQDSYNYVIHLIFNKSVSQL